MNINRAVSMKVEAPESLSLTLTLTLPVSYWRHVKAGGYHSTFDAAVTGAINRLERISGSTPLTFDPYVEDDK